MTHVTYSLTAKNRDQLWNPTLGYRVWATFILLQCSGDKLRQSILSASLPVYCFNLQLSFLIVVNKISIYLNSKKLRKTLNYKHKKCIITSKSVSLQI